MKYIEIKDQLDKLEDELKPMKYDIWHIDRSIRSLEEMVKKKLLFDDSFKDIFQEKVPDSYLYHWVWRNDEYVNMFNELCNNLINTLNNRKADINKNVENIENKISELKNLEF